MDHELTAKWHISIHAPLAGRDRVRIPSRPSLGYFNPRAPCGARRIKMVQDENLHEFQSTRPLRGATSSSPGKPNLCFISIHAPLAGRDWNWTTMASAPRRFQSTRPLRGATTSVGVSGQDMSISIHAPLAGRDSKSAQKNAALLRKRYKYKLFVCKKCTSGDLTGTYSSKNTLCSGANCSENPCALSVRTHRISGPSTSNPGLMPKCSILERYFSPR